MCTVRWSLVSATHLNLNIKSKFDARQKLAFRWSEERRGGRGPNWLHWATLATLCSICKYPRHEQLQLDPPVKTGHWSGPGYLHEIANVIHVYCLIRNCSRYSSRMSTCSDPDRPDTDDENSQRSYSNASSPSGSLQQTPNYVSLRVSNTKLCTLSALLQVLSASGGQIIAVQNPALSLSGAFPGRTAASPPPPHPAPAPPSAHPPPTSMTGILLSSVSRCIT